MSEHRSPIIVDTNILFSALLREPSPLVELLFRSEYEFYICDIHQPVDLPLEDRLFLRRASGGAALVQAWHLLDQSDHAGVAGDVGCNNSMLQ